MVGLHAYGWDNAFHVYVVCGWSGCVVRVIGGEDVIRTCVGNAVNARVRLPTWCERSRGRRTEADHAMGRMLRGRVGCIYCRAPV